ncbi:hypothetical protein RHMOL_Rhmol04G0175000 [Rhododendron molle]|uniref:Uncharacterized protein n=1 Tax=Rhododendron molle TaxID=49168 RepID=A0ACC0P3Q1_RHOML|nr:hypothetical protein RHMOL_Rhmol04G0175000 [Rhododendron molle]
MQYYTISMGGQKFYVVFVGKKPGIYNDWPACSEQVNRFPGPVHKKYASWDEAYNAWVTFTRQVEETAPPSLLPLAADPSGSSMDYTHPARDWFGLGLVLTMVFFLGVVVAIIIIMVCHHHRKRRRRHSAEATRRANISDRQPSPPPRPEFSFFGRGGDSVNNRGGLKAVSLLPSLNRHTIGIFRRRMRTQALPQCSATDGSRSFIHHHHLTPSEMKILIGWLLGSA